MTECPQQHRPNLAFDLTPLQEQEEALREEVGMLADAVNKCIYENAHVALGQTEYRKRYDGLTERYDEAKKKLDTITEQISDKIGSASDNRGVSQSTTGAGRVGYGVSANAMVWAG